MTGADRAIRYSTIAAVSIVAIIAAVISYQHATAVIRAHGESGVIARIYAGTIDGLIYAASMALLDAARRQLPAPVLARWLLGVGIAATLAANIAAGLAYGPVGALVAAWPAGALVGSYELLMVIIRQSASSVPVPGVPEAGNGAPAQPDRGAAEVRRPDRQEGGPDHPRDTDRARRGRSQGRRGTASPAGAHPRLSGKHKEPRQLPGWRGSWLLRGGLDCMLQLSADGRRGVVALPGEAELLIVVPVLEQEVDVPLTLNGRAEHLDLQLFRCRPDRGGRVPGRKDQEPPPYVVAALIEACP